MLAKFEIKSSHGTYTNKGQTMTKEIEWILVSEAAEIMKMHVESVRRLCRKDNPPIRCRQLFHHGPWQVAKEDALSYEKPTHKNT